MNEIAAIYNELAKPAWAPPAWIFGPVWAFLYGTILISFGYTFYKTLKGEWPRKIALPFVLNLVFNFLFTYVQFGLQNNVLAAIDVLLVFTTLIWGMKAVFIYARWVTYINIPYVLWVSFASVLQLTITFLAL